MFYFTLQCVTVDMERPVKRFVIKVNDGSSLDYSAGEEEKKEGLRIYVSEEQLTGIAIVPGEKKKKNDC